MKIFSRVYRVCAVAQYAVLQANAKVNGWGQFSHPHPFETPHPITTLPQRVDVQNLVRIDSAVTDLRMREKNTFCVDFLFTYLSIYLSVYLSVYPFFLRGYTGHSFVAILTLNNSNDVISQPWVPFGGHTNIALY